VELRWLHSNAPGAQGVLMSFHNLPREAIEACEGLTHPLPCPRPIEQAVQRMERDRAAKAQAVPAIKASERIEMFEPKRTGLGALIVLSPWVAIGFGLMGYFWDRIPFIHH
jgi:hypothetical protein